MTAPDEPPSAVAERPKRPGSVTLVAALAVGVAFYSLISGVLAMVPVVAAETVPVSAQGPLADGILHLALGVAALAVGLGALRLHRWAWAAFMTWAVIGLTNQILRYLVFGDPNYADMAINTFAVLVLSPLDVQIAFRLRHTQNVELARPTRNPLDRH